jgi:hypothetical protein
VEVRIPGRVAQEFEVQAKGSELGQGHDGSIRVGIQCLGGRKKLQRVVRAQTLSHVAIHGSGRKGEGARKECVLGGPSLKGGRAE